LTLDVFGVPFPAGQTTVVGGSFTITAVQPVGRSFSGKTVSFTVDGNNAGATGTWMAGGADIIGLDAN